MKTHNAENVRIKREYFTYLKEAMGHSEQTVDAVAKALARFEEYNKMRDFKAFHYEQAVGFKKALAEQRGQQSGEKLSKATLHATLANLKRFFHWLAGQPGYKSKFQYSDANYFNLSDNDVRVATAKREQKAPTLNKMLIEIKNLFGLNLSQLATIIGVSRPQLYKWIDGDGSQKSSQINQKIAVFYSFAQSVPAGDAAFFGRFANKYVSHDMRVIDVLSSNDTSEKELSSVYGSIANDIKLLKEKIS